MESKSGNGILAMSGIAKEMSLLSKADYLSLRQSGKIHQIQEINKGHSGSVITSSNAAFERFGGGSTKIGYIRIPIIKENMELLRKKYNNENLGYLILAIGFGDFKNEGLDEKKLYEQFKGASDRYMDEIESIIKVFNEPFTPETFTLACSMIEHGVDVVDLLKNRPLESIERNGNLVK